MKKIFTFCVSLLTALSVFAYDFQSGDLFYNITSNSAPYTVEVTYQEYSLSYTGLTSVIIPETVTYEGTTYSVTSIGSGAFSGCSSLTSVTIPNSVTSIGERAFSSSSSLTSMIVENGNTIYDSRENCNAIIETATNTLIAGCQNTIIPNSVTSIGDYAFYDCSSLTSITIPNSVTSIGERAFANCSSLTSIIIGSNVTSIGVGAFQFCSAVSSIIIPSNVTSIGNWAFGDCSSLTSITIPKTISNIGINPFAGCSGLSSIVVENGNAIYDSRGNCNAIVETATNTLISGCQNTIIPNDVTSIGSYAFGKCSFIFITIPNSVISIGGNAFADCSSLTDIAIPNSVTSIGDDAFQNCSSLTSITIGNSVTSIGRGAFSRCSSLTSITIPNSVTSLGELAFLGCSSLTSITIPNSVTSIEYGTFWGCSSLDTIYVEATTPTTLGQNVFEGTPSPLCVIPCGTLAEYEMSRWKNYVEAFVFDDTCEDKWCGDNLYWKYRNGVLTLIGTGDMYDYASDIDIPWYDVHDKITSINIPNGISKIGNNAFASCISLDEIYVEAAMPSALGNNALASSPICFIPCGAIATYQSSNWASQVGEFVEVCPAVVKAKVPASWEDDDITVWVWTDGAGTEYPTTKEGDWYVYTHTDTEEFNIIFKSGTGWKDEMYHRTQTVDIKGITENTCLEIQPTTGKATYTIVDCNNTGIIYKGNGGITNGYGWMSKDDMYHELLVDINAIIPTTKVDVDTVTLAYDKTKNIQEGIPTYWGSLDSLFTNFDFLSKWSWLINYMDSTCVLESKSLPSTSSAYLRFNLSAFFIEKERTAWPTTPDYSKYGLYSYYQPAWQHGFANPTNPMGDFILNAPYREGYTFAGWYTTPDFSGDKVTTINAETEGTLYAKWIDETWVIKYTSTDGNIVTPYATDVFGANIVNNTYEDGVGTLTFDGAVTCIGDSAFYNCDGLVLITIPNNVTSIGNNAFYNCDGLISMTIPNSVTSVGDFAFFRCLGFSSITIPNGVTKIGSHAFRECSSLKSITIPSSVIEIGRGAFEGAFENYSGLVSITVDSDNRIYDSRENCNAIIETATNTLVVGCQNTIIPNSVTIIGERAFRGSTFTSITIPSSVTSIEYWAFFECDSLDAIYMEAMIPPTLGNQVFNVADSFSMHIPCGTLAAYEASDWAQHVSEFIEEGCISFELNGGVVSAELPIYIASSYTLPTPTREGYIFRGWYNNPQGIGNQLYTLPAGYEGIIYAYWTKEPTDALNPFAYALSSELSQDKSQLLVNYSLNARATDVQIVIMDGETAVKTIACDGLSKGSHSIAIPTAGLPEHKQLTWKVEVKGAEVTEPTEYAVNYSFYYPSAVDIDNNPENPTFGMILTNEGMHEVKDINGYLSTGYGAGIYAFNPAFEPMPNGDKPGYNGGIEFTEKRADAPDSITNGYTAFSPRRIRISEDGRIFVTSLNTDGNYLWEVNPENMNEWNSIFKGTLNGDKELVDAGGNFIAAPNTGFDVKGSGEDLQLMMYSVNLPGITAAYMTGFRCDEYNLGTATEWTTAPSKNWVNGKYAIHYTGTQVEYDNEGGIWIASYRGAASDANPGLVHINAAGEEDAKLLWNNVRNAGIRFNNDFTKLVVAGNNGSANKATIYAVSKDANGAPVLTEEWVIDATYILGKNLNDFAFDYAGNLYACGNSTKNGEKLVAWAMPRSADEVITTPAASKYSFVISDGNATPRAWAYDLALVQEAEAYTFTFKATTAANATLIFTDVEGIELAAVELGAVEAGLNTKTLAASELPQGKKVNWAVKMAGEAIVAGETLLEVTDQTRGIYDFYNMMDVLVDNNPESEHFSTIYIQMAFDGATDGATDRADTQTSGFFIYDQELNELNPTTNVGIKPTLPEGYNMGDNRNKFHRLDIDPKTGFLTWCYNMDAQPAVFAVDPANLAGDATNIVAGVTGLTRTAAHCYDAEGTLYIMDIADSKGSIYKIVDGQAVQLTEPTGKLVNASMTLAADGKGGLWVAHNRGQMDTYYQIVHVTAAGELDYTVWQDNTNGFEGSCSRGALAYDVERQILAQGRNGAVELFNVAYDAETGVPTLTKFAVTPTVGNNIDGLHFDYAGDLYVVNTSKEKFQKFVVPTDNNVCTTPAASKYSFVISDGNNIITYTSTDGNIITPYATDVFGANIVSNIYENGVGTITFDAPLTRIGTQAFHDCFTLTSIIVPNSVKIIGNAAFSGTYLESVVIGSGVTSIGEDVFGGCGLLTSIVVDTNNTTFDSREDCNAIIKTSNNILVAGCKTTIIPNTIKGIGNYAFAGSWEMTSIEIPDGVETIGSSAFGGCTVLRSVMLPNSLVTIGDDAFSTCPALTSITIPSSVKRIGADAFWCDYALDTLYVEATTPPTLGYKPFYNAPVTHCFIPCGTLSAYEASAWASQVGEFVEDGCAPIQMCGDDLYWEYADGVLTITGTGDMYDYAADTDVPWYDVRGNIKTVSLPDAMTKIGQNAFYKCTAMTTINMPTSLIAIGEKAFAQDTKLTGELTLPASLTTIDERAFFNCKAVTAFHVEATTPPTVQADAFDYTTAPIHVPCGYGHIYGKHTQWGMLNLEMCELLQDNVYYYPIDGHTARAVTYHSNPTDTIVIPSVVVIDGVLRTVTEVADFAFTDCDNLPAIYFNEGLEHIGERAFVRCYGLKGTITLPTTLTTIGERAFSYCDNVEKYLLQAMTPPVLGEDVFTGNNKNALFYISCEAMDDYKVATNWSSLKSRLRDACLNIYHYNTTPLGTNGVYTTEDTLVASIYYRRQFTPYRWETLYLPFEVDRVTVLEDGVEYDLNAWSIFSGGHYYLAKPYGIENKEIVFGFTQVVDAHTPYIIQFKDEYYRDKIITFYSEESWNKLSTSFEMLSSSYEMQMAGNTTMQDQILDQPVYMLRGTSNFILQKTTTTLHPFECYVMPYTAQSGAPARMSVRFRGDVPTAVESVMGNESRLAYTINGNTLTVYPQGQAFSIYSLNGALIYSCEAGKEAVDCELNSGCYLLHAGTEAHKIML